MSIFYLKVLTILKVYFDVFQGLGKELWQAHGKFRGNGGCGYILKPKFLLENSPTGEVFNPLKFKQPEIKFKVSFSQPFYQEP